MHYLILSNRPQTSSRYMYILTLIIGNEQVVLLVSRGRLKLALCLEEVSENVEVSCSFSELSRFTLLSDFRLAIVGRLLLVLIADDEVCNTSSILLVNALMFRECSSIWSFMKSSWCFTTLSATLSTLATLLVAEDESWDIPLSLHKSVCALRMLAIGSGCGSLSAKEDF